MSDNQWVSTKALVVQSFVDFLCDGQEVAGAEERIHAVPS